MPSPAFLTSLPFVLRWEGGFVNHPDDPGGATNKGVTQAVYDAWRAREDLGPRPVELIEDAEVEAIYESGYWLPPRCERLRRKLDLVQFDTAVNMGVGRAVRLLQGALGVAVDGVFGPRTEQAAARADLAKTTTDYCASREAYYRRLAAQRPRLAVFLKGWLNRLDALRGEAGMAGFSARRSVDFGDAPFIRRIPDVGQDPDYDV